MTSSRSFGIPDLAMSRPSSRSWTPGCRDCGMRKSRDPEKNGLEWTLNLLFPEASVSLLLSPSVASTVALFCTTRSSTLVWSGVEYHRNASPLKSGKCTFQIIRVVSFHAWGTPNTTMSKTTNATSTQVAISAWAPGVRLALVSATRPTHQYMHTNLHYHSAIREMSGGEKWVTYSGNH